MRRRQLGAETLAKVAEIEAMNAKNTTRAGAILSSAKEAEENSSAQVNALTKQQAQLILTSSNGRVVLVEKLLKRGVSANTHIVTSFLPLFFSDHSEIRMGSVACIMLLQIIISRW